MIDLHPGTCLHLSNGHDGHAQFQAQFLIVRHTGHSKRSVTDDGNISELPQDLQQNLRGQGRLFGNGPIPVSFRWPRKLGAGAMVRR